MKKRPILFFFLSVLLSGCGRATPTALPTATMPSNSGPIPTQTSLPTSQSTPTTPPASDSRLRRVAQLGGSINGIVVLGDLAYVGMGPHVAAIDISNHQHPQLVAQSEQLPGLVTRLIQISSGPAPFLLVNAGKYLVLMDISEPEQLKPVHQLELEGAISAMVWDESARMVYAGWSISHSPSPTGYLGFIAGIGLTQENEFKLNNSVTMPERPLSLALSEGSLFAGAEGYEGGLYRIPVSAPGALSAPQRVIDSTMETPLQPLSMQVIGQTLVLSYTGVEAYDITDPDHPVQTWKRDSGGGTVIDSFTLAGGQAYFFGWTILSEYVRSAMALPGPITGAPAGVGTSDTALHNGDFLVAANDLEIYAAANPQDLRLVGSYQSPLTNAYDAVMNEKAVFVLDLGAADGLSRAVLRVLSLPDLNPIGEVTTEIRNHMYSYRAPYIALETDRLYLASLEGVWAYDVSRPLPVLLGKVEIAAEKLDAITAIHLQGKRLLAVAQEGADQSSVLRVFDLTDWQKPVEMGSPLSLDQGDVLRIVWSGSAFYVHLESSYHSHNDMFYVVHLENDVLTLGDTLKLAEFTGYMAGDEKLILVTDLGEDARRSSFSTVAPAPLRVLARTALPERAAGIGLTGDKAFVVVGEEYGTAQLLLYDMKDPAGPKQVDSIDIPVNLTSHVSILVSGPYVVLANGQGGVEVFRTGS